MTEQTLILLTTVDDITVANSFSRSLIEQRLAACVSIQSPITSTYRWAGKIETSSEYQLVIKTTRACLNELESFFKSNHPYDCPEFLVLDTVHSNPYTQWVSEETTSTP